jgi:ribosome maturation factor RimP
MIIHEIQGGLCPTFCYKWNGMNIYQTQLEEQICQLIEPALKDMGYEPVRIRLMGTARNKTLQIMIDRRDGKAITVDDCEAASRHVSVLLDVGEIISSHYNLELSSAGINRPLTRRKDFAKYLGEVIKLTTKIAIAGQRNFTGRLQSATDDNIVLLPKESMQEISIAFTNIGDATLQPVLNLKQEKPNLKKRRK